MNLFKREIFDFLGSLVYASSFSVLNSICEETFLFPVHLENLDNIKCFGDYKLLNFCFTFW